MTWFLVFYMTPAQQSTGPQVQPTTVFSVMAYVYRAPTLPSQRGFKAVLPPALTRLVSTHSVVLFAAFCSSTAVTTREGKASTGEIRNVLIKPIRFRRIFLLPWFTVFLVCMAKNVEQGCESPVLSFLCFLKEISVKL